MALPPISYPHGADLPTDVVQLGPDLDDDSISRLIGPVDGKRVLDLGCGAGAASIALARRGARVIAVESSTARLAQARTAAELAEVHIEFHHSDLADLAFLRADSVELVVAVYSLAGVGDLGRVFRQLHRVLRPEAPVVLSFPHPFATMLELDPEEQQTPYLTRTYWSENPLAWRAGGDEGITHVHQIGDVFTHLHRSNFRVDGIVEPIAEVDSGRSLHRSDLARWVPTTLIVRGRKQGI